MEKIPWEDLQTCLVQTILHCVFDEERGTMLRGCPVLNSDLIKLVKAATRGAL